MGNRAIPPDKSRITEITRIILPVLRRHKVSSAAIFGSYARGDEDENSDLDLMVEFSGSPGLLGVMKVKLDLEDVLGRTVDLTSLDSLHPAVREKAVSEQVRII